MRRFFQTEFIKYVGVKGYKPIEYMNTRKKIPKLYHIVNTTHYGFLSVVAVRESITNAGDRFTMPIIHTVIPTSEFELDSHINDALSKIEKDDLLLVSDIEIKTEETFKKLIDYMDKKDLPFFNVFSYDGPIKDMTKVPVYAALNGRLPLNVLMTPAPALSLLDTVSMTFNVNPDKHNMVICDSFISKGAEILSTVRSYMIDRDNTTAISKLCYKYMASHLIRMYTTIGEDSPLYFNKDSRLCFNISDDGISEPVDIMRQLNSIMESINSTCKPDVANDVANDDDDDTFYKDGLIRPPFSFLD